MIKNTKNKIEKQIELISDQYKYIGKEDEIFDEEKLKYILEILNEKNKEHRRIQRLNSNEKWESEFQKFRNEMYSLREKGVKRIIVSSNKIQELNYYMMKETNKYGGIIAKYSYENYMYNKSPLFIEGVIVETDEKGY